MSVKTELMRSEKCVNHKTKDAIIRIVNDNGARNIRAGVPLCGECVKEIAEFYTGVTEEQPVEEPIVEVPKTPVAETVGEDVDTNVEKQEKEEQFEKEPEEETQESVKEESEESDANFLDQLDLGGE